MNQIQIANDFINLINQKDYDKIYQFFTKESTLYLLNVHNEISVEELKNFLTNNINDQLIVKRQLESNVCVKIETNQLNLYFAIKRKRIRRLELELV